MLKSTADGAVMLEKPTISNLLPASADASIPFLTLVKRDDHLRRWTLLTGRRKFMIDEHRKASNDLWKLLASIFLYMDPTKTLVYTKGENIIANNATARSKKSQTVFTKCCLLCLLRTQ